MVSVSLPGIFQVWILEQRFQCRYLILDVILPSTARKVGEWDRMEVSLWRYNIKQISTLGTAAAKSLQLCPTLCNPIDGSPPGSPVPGILQARTLEWVAISFSNAWKWKVKVKSLSHVRLLATPWTTTHQAPPSVGFSRQEYWSGLPLPSLPLWVTWT